MHTTTTKPTPSSAVAAVESANTGIMVRELRELAIRRGCISRGEAFRICDSRERRYTTGRTTETAQRRHSHAPSQEMLRSSVSLVGSIRSDDLQRDSNMLRWMGTLRHRQTRAAAVLLLSAAIVSVIAPKALAMIIGGAGNKPIADPGWPKGAAAIFNTKSRIAWWEGPPFGGGQWHSECRGDAKAFNEILAGFARLDVKDKHLIVHDGVGSSFWLNSNNEPAKQAGARMDWVLMVWHPQNWERLRDLPAQFKPTDVAGAKNGPPAQIDVYAGGNIRWADVTVPRGLEVVDQRTRGPWIHCRRRSCPRG